MALLVVAMTMVLLFLAFGSVVMPIKAVLMREQYDLTGDNATAVATGLQRTTSGGPVR